MKKTLLILALVIAPMSYSVDGIRADSFLDDCTIVETSPIFLDEEIGAVSFALIQDKAALEELTRMIKLNFSSEKISRFKEILKIMIDFELVTKDSEFEEQWIKFIEASQRLNNPSVTDAEIKAELDVLEKECPLIVKQKMLYEKLKGFYSGLAKGIQGIKMNEIIEYILVELD